MKKVRSFIPVILSLLAIFSSCHKDQQIPLQPYPKNCQDNGFDTMPYSYGEPMIYADSLNIQFPYFNPNNPNEIIYYLGYRRELIKYNIANKTKQILYKGQLFNRAKWSRKGWMLIPADDGQIWKIKDDGTQLTQLTFGSMGHLYPEWNMEGTKFGCWAVTKGNSYTIIYDEFGAAIDSLKSPLTGCWQGRDTNILLGAGGSAIGYTDIRQDSFILLFRWPPSNQNEFHDSYWMQDGINAIVVANNGIYSFNTQTKKLTFLKQFCPHDYYYSLSISYQSNKILLQKSTWYFVGNNRVFIKTKLVLMNPDGSGETEIEI